MTYLIGDIGNTETKLCILNKNYKIIKKIKIDTTKIINKHYFRKKIYQFVRINVKSKKAIFASVVPSVFLIVKKRLNKYFKIQSKELKKTKYSKLIKLEVNRKQIGSDRIANAIGAYQRYRCDKQKSSD